MAAGDDGAGDVIDQLTRDAADHLGLTPDIPVVQGGADAFIGMIGLGVTEPGEMALITGSSHLHLGVAAKPVHKPGMWGTYMDAVYPDKPIIEGGQTSTGSVIAWFKRHFAADTSFEALNEEPRAHSSPARRSGGAGPFPGQPHALYRCGLTRRHHGPDAQAHAGACLSARSSKASASARASSCRVSATLSRAKRIVVAGGATNSPLWLQIHADTIGVPLELTEVPDAPALGCAILAAHGAGRFATIEDGCKAMVRSPHRRAERC